MLKSLCAHCKCEIELQIAVLPNTSRANSSLNENNNSARSRRKGFPCDVNILSIGRTAGMPGIPARSAAH